MTERLEAHDPITGRGVEVNPGKVIVNKADPLARTIAVVGLGLGALGLGVGAYSQLNKERVQDYGPRITDVEDDLFRNYIGDCVNENIVRQMTGTEMIDLDDCIDIEREEWVQKYWESKGGQPEKEIPGIDLVPQTRPQTNFDEQG